MTRFPVAVKWVVVTVAVVEVMLRSDPPCDEVCRDEPAPPWRVFWLTSLVSLNEARPRSRILTEEGSRAASSNLTWWRTSGSCMVHELALLVERLETAGGELLEPTRDLRIIEVSVLGSAFDDVLGEAVRQRLKRAPRNSVCGHFAPAL